MDENISGSKLYSLAVNKQQSHKLPTPFQNEILNGTLHVISIYSIQIQTAEHMQGVMIHFRAKVRVHAGGHLLQPEVSASHMAFQTPWISLP